ncbi:MAG: LPD7 domain-containing protein [Neisseria sp.]|uniref:LPD7 domain-containing protein n=1 Tax=Neisseria sp. TaxID=192066 RepID=UPI0026DAE0F1|nr:LPD7 domain-containing protein [Neisseria sp.]MDO4641710.1 LPD7 domain-containing protein [Neisseria sp.]
MANAQVVNDMLEVAKEKGWDSLKLNGSKEFKAMMYVAAESQGIRTSGYTPTEADKAAVARLLQERSLNSVESRPAREMAMPEPAAQSEPVKQNDGRIVAYGSAPYRNDPKAQPSYYLTLEQQGKTHTVWGIGLADALEQSGAQPGDTIRLHHLGRQAVTVETPVYDEQGAVVDHKTLNTHHNQFQIEVAERQAGQEPEQQAEQEQEKKVRTQPDVAALSAADKLEAQSALPSDSTVNVSERADTQPGVPVHAIGSEEVPAQVHRQANDLRSEALNTEMVAAKTAYMEKAAKLSKQNKARLRFYERSTMDALRGLTGDVRTKALRNYYEHTEKMMSGSKLKLPEPAQIPAPGQSVAEQQMQQQTRQQQAERHHQQQQEIVPEIER